MHNPNIIAAVREVLGLTPEQALLCWSSDFNVKPPSTSNFYSWHQDGRFLKADDVSKLCTVWVAFSSATKENGCLEFVPTNLSSSCLLPHTITNDANNMLSRGQTINEDQLEHLCDSFRIELNPGQFSIHSFLTPHRSGPNTESRERIGFAIRYMTSDVVFSNKIKESALLVSGDSPLKSCSFDLDFERAPATLCGVDEIRCHHEAIERENANYLDGTEMQVYTK